MVARVSPMTEIAGSTIEAKVIDILREQALLLDDDVPIIGASRLDVDLDLDEFSEIEIGAELGAAFNIIMPIDFFVPGLTVSDLVALVQEEIARQTKLTTIDPDVAEGSAGDIDWLVHSKPKYASSVLATWPERQKSAPLAKLAKLRRACPDYLQKATDYLFEAAAYGYEQEETLIPRSEVEARSLDRRESMVGGFPWTDESHPWPSHHGSDGQPIWAEPIFQLNLEKLSQQLGLRLPSSLIQCWDGFEPMEIPLAQTTGEPSWFRPNQAEEPSVGWRHSEAQYVGSYISAGSSAFQLPRMEQFLDGSAAYYDEYVFQNEDEWKDLLEWQESTPDIEGSQFDALAGEAHEAFAALKPVSTEFLGVPTRSEVSYEDWVKDGYKLLYSASGSGLHIWYGGFLMIFYRLRDGRFEFAVQMGS